MAVKNIMAVCLGSWLISACATHSWDHQHPDRWVKISRLCGVGENQSPIDLGAAVHSDNLPTLDLHYEKTAVTWINNTHTVEAEVAAGNDGFDWQDKHFVLKQFHFHHPSEHTRNGEHQPLEIHFVHQAASGELAVVAVFVKVASKDNSDLVGPWPKLPGEHDDVSVNLSHLMPNTKSYTTYHGSLTTPPCTENVTWFVLTEPITMSAPQVQQLTSILHDDNRATMPVHGRAVLSR